MKTFQIVPGASRLAMVLLALNFVSAALADEAGGGATTASEAVEIPRSVFNAAMAEGKDPFFPKSTRRIRTPEAPKVEAAPRDVTKAIKLKGISGTMDQRLAIINNRTFAVGESDYVEVDRDRVHILLKEIRDESVIVVINKSHWKELKLREGV